ncbi:hypothetical protein N7467_000825 [Penicillium canescens]|nr:hypothetical protein N7467_000825 [Penicillium canescens]
MDEDMVASAASDTADNQRVVRRHRARHTKSRNGCYPCKFRRVKCDEIQPTCGTCSSRGEPCSYPPPRVPSKRPPRSRPDIEKDDGKLLSDPFEPSTTRLHPALINKYDSTGDHLEPIPPTPARRSRDE